MDKTANPPKGLACEALEDWDRANSASGLGSLRVKLRDGEVRDVCVSDIYPEDRWHLCNPNGKFKYLGCPASGSQSPLAIVTCTPEMNFCGGDIIELSCSQSSDRYKKGKSTIPLMVIGSYIAKRNAGGPTWHVRIYFSAQKFNYDCMLDYFTS